MKGKSLFFQTHSLYKEFTDAPQIFRLMASLSNISTSIGKFFYFPWWRSLRLNLYIVLSSIPGVTRRSTVVDFNKKIWFASQQHYLQSITSDAKEGKQLVWQGWLNDGTMQGICDAIADAENNGTYKRMDFFLCNDEFGSVMAKITGSKQSFEQQLLGFLSSIYYGNSYKANLSNRNKDTENTRFIPRGIYFSIFSAMQKPGEYLTEHSITQGLLRRMLIPYVRAADLDLSKHRSPYNQNFAEIFRQAESLGKTFGEEMITLHKEIENNKEKYSKGLIPLTCNKQARMMIEKIDRDCKERIVADDSAKNTYLQSKWEHVLKIAGNIAISRGRREVIVKDVDLSMQIVDAVHKNVDEMIDSIQQSTKQKTTTKNLNMVESKIKAAGPKGIKRTDLLNRCRGIVSKDLDRYIATLFDRHLIGMKKTNVNRPGATGKRYIHLMFKES